MQRQRRYIVQSIVAALFVIAVSSVALQLYAKPYDDLPTFYWATKAAIDEGLSAYEPQHFRELSRSLERKIYPFLYPPPSVLIFSPMLLGDYTQVKIFVSVCNVLLWCLLAGLSHRLYCFYAGRGDNFLSSLLIPLWLLIFMPIIDTLRTGQVDLFVLVCVMPLLFQGSIFQKRARCWQFFCGTFLAVAIILKIYLLLLLPVLIVLRQWRLLVTTFIVLIVLIVLSLCLLPHSMWMDWLMLSQQSGGYGKQIPNLMTIPWNQSINGVFIRQFLGDGILNRSTHWVWVAYACSASVLALTFFLIVQFLRYSVQGLSSATALMLLAITLVSPLTWLHHFVFALPAILYCMAELSKSLQKIWRKILFFLLMVFVGIMSQPFLIGLISSILSAQFFAALGVFCVFLLIVTTRRPRPVLPEQH